MQHSVPKGLEDVSKYPHLFATLLESDKWTEADIAKVAGRNLIRVFKEVEAVSKQLKDAKTEISPPVPTTPCNQTVN